ncbi:serine hydrolase [Xanthobacter sp. AM11]|uniref:D-alanyl-D-alanine carboxypeptidase family protein n=1 Tax=Xanthobacter sp. AM11 TaxID=3380643 RepID=UPI0039BEFDD1
MRTKSSRLAGVTWLPLAAALLGLLPALLLALPAQAGPVLLVEADSGRVLEQKDAGRPWYPASVTKLMTVYVALNAVKAGRVTMDTPLTVSAVAASQQPSKMGFKPGTVVTLDNAIKMVMVKSANDMAVVVAEGVGGSLPAFVAEMNAVAAHLGMTGTHFENPNGLPDPDQVTTARDLAILARAIIYHFPEHEMLFRIPAIRIGKAVLRNYNRLIDRYPGADGMKTGFICSSGYNLVATATRGNKRLIAVVLGARSGVARTEQTALLFEKGFQSSWTVFGSASPLLSGLQNQGGAPGDMKAEVCGGRRVASEADDEPDPNASAGFAFATPTLPKSGAELLQTLPPSMPPVQVYVGTRSAPQDLSTAYAQEEKPKKKQTAAKPASSPASKPADADGGTATASTGEGAPAKKQAAKPKPASSGSATAAAKPKPDAASGSASAAPAKKQVQPAAPVTAGSVPAPKPKPKPAAAPAATPAAKPPEAGTTAAAKPAT